MTRFADTLFSATIRTAALTVAIGTAAPAWAAPDYPTAVAADAAAVMAQYGGVVIDVETLFPGENRALTFIGCGVQKRDPDRSATADEQLYNFTRCKQTIADKILPPYVPPVDIIQRPTSAITDAQNLDNVYEPH